MIMKVLVALTILLLFIAGCSTVQTPLSVPTTRTISENQELLLNAQDLQQLGMTGNRTACTTESYQTSANSPLAQYSFCNYSIDSLNNTQVVIELQKFTNLADLNGTYQYSSLHLRSAEGLLSENDYGDQSRFYVNNEHDYGGQYNNKTVHYYHLWISKNEYLIHITSEGNNEAKEYIARIGRQILSKFG